jgi:hypothetical protein
MPKILEGFGSKTTFGITECLKIPYFNDLVKERLEYFNDNLNDILSKIDDYETYLEKSQKKNFELYPDLLDPSKEVWPVPARFDNHHDYVKYLKNWIQERMAWLITWI